MNPFLEKMVSKKFGFQKTITGIPSAGKKNIEEIEKFKKEN